jgi:hypothetical protein
VAKLNKSGAVISETVSSEHDTGKLSEMFRLLKTGYRKLFDTPLFYRYVVSDLCWPTIHAVLELMNLEEIEDYSKRIFRYASMKEEEIEPSQQKGFLASCISHSTHRFTRGLKKYVSFSEKEHKIFACCCFSILANAGDLETVKHYFRLMCETFKRQNDDDTCKTARKTLQSIIEKKLEDKTEIIKCINEAYPDLLDSETDIENENSQNLNETGE